MECKCTILTVITHGIKELIDTLWNVNSVFAKNLTRLIKELIDTLWNVNFIPYDEKYLKTL